MACSRRTGKTSPSESGETCYEMRGKARRPIGEVPKNLRGLRDGRSVLSEGHVEAMVDREDRMCSGRRTSGYGDDNGAARLFAASETSTPWLA